ncbi:MAG: maltose alpha-D-glucosyltransferase [Leptospiraceae bacterium]|nr:maltose alpha-D-glucosyltransferase [Leptospiraceae bacterium]
MPLNREVNTASGKLVGRKKGGLNLLDNSDLWYMDAVIYELHVRSFCDANGDGIGDFPGLMSRLEYLRGLGVTALWLLPFYPSPLRDDGYDIADYKNVNPIYGTLKDFKDFLSMAHEMGMRVITELVINHTSDQHPWFQRARQAPREHPDRDYYVWSDTPDKYRDVRIIFQDFENSNWTWDELAGQYYWHRFYSHQPDLNFENHRVQQEVFDVLDFWLDMGVDGMRLDAIPYLYEKEGTTCENLPETHAFLKKLRAHVDGKYRGRLLLAEANQWPEDSVTFFGEGDECNMAFHFPLMPRMFMSIRMEDSFPIVDIIEQTPDLPDGCQWAVFLRNHDELTLEMVTDEERDYMVRMYARDPRSRINLGIRRRLAPLLENDRRKIELMHALLFSMPGTPVIYYGDEIGMGDNIFLGDRDSVRTPMQWSPDRNAGFSRANPQRLFLPVNIDPDYHYESLNVEAQQNSPNSLLWWIKRIISLRKQIPAFSRGSLEFIRCENRKILAFFRKHEDQTILVLANLSAQVQYANLDLGEHAGKVPVEMFSRHTFPRITQNPYFFSFAPFSFFWFSLESETQHFRGPDEVPEIRLNNLPSLASLLESRARELLSPILPDFLRQQDWFPHRTRSIKSAEIVHSVHPWDDEMGLAIIEVQFSSGEIEFYQTCFQLEEEDQPEQLWYGLTLEDISERVPIVARLVVTGDGRSRGFLLRECLGRWEPAQRLLDAALRNKQIRSDGTRIVPELSKEGKNLLKEIDVATAPIPFSSKYSNIVFNFGDSVIFKLYRRMEEGVHPELETGRALTEQGGTGSPAALGSLTYTHDDFAMSAGSFWQYVQNQGTALMFTRDNLESFLRIVPALSYSQPNEDVMEWTRNSGASMPDVLQQSTGNFLISAQGMGETVADLHAHLRTVGDLPHRRDFAVEPFTSHYRRALYQGLRNTLDYSISELRKSMADLDSGIISLIGPLMEYQKPLDRMFQQVKNRSLDSGRIRLHGDLHLGQLLYTGKGFIVLDYEGSVHRSFSERRIKGSPLRDVAGMIWSFALEAMVTTNGREFPGLSESQARRWVTIWYNATSTMFLAGYLEHMARTASWDLLPAERAQVEELLNIFLLERGLQSLGHILPDIRNERRHPGELESRLQALLMIATHCISL